MTTLGPGSDPITAVIGFHVECTGDQPGWDGPPQTLRLSFSWSYPWLPMPGLPTAGAGGGAFIEDGVVYVDTIFYGVDPDIPGDHGDTTGDLAARVAEQIKNAEDAGLLPPGKIEVEWNGVEDSPGNKGLCRILCRGVSHIDALPTTQKCHLTLAAVWDNRLPGGLPPKPPKWRLEILQPRRVEPAGGGGGTGPGPRWWGRMSELPYESPGWSPREEPKHPEWLPWKRRPGDPQKYQERQFLNEDGGWQKTPQPPPRRRDNKAIERIEDMPRRKVRGALVSGWLTVDCILDSGHGIRSTVPAGLHSDEILARLLEDLGGCGLDCGVVGNAIAIGQHPVFGLPSLIIVEVALEDPGDNCAYVLHRPDDDSIDAQARAQCCMAWSRPAATPSNRWWPLVAIAQSQTESAQRWG